MTTRVYVGNLPMDIRTREVEDIFYKYGRIRDIDIKFPSRPPAFAFVDFEDPRDAEDAIDGRDGYDYDGNRLRVEPANAGGKRGSRGGSRYPRNVRGTGEFAVEVSGLPSRASWQDLKDYMRKAGDVLFSEVDGRGHGLVEYSNKDDMKDAVEKLDDSEFRSRGDRAYIRVRIARSRSDSRNRSRSRSPRRSSKRKPRRSSRSRSGSRSVSRSRSKSRSRKGSKKDRRSRSRSRSASRSRSKSASKSPERKAKEEKSANDENGKTPEPASEVKELSGKQDWTALKVDELRDELKKRGLDVEGEQADLIKRLEEHDAK